MGSSSSSSSSTSSSTPNDPDCYMRNKMIRQQYLRTRPDSEDTVPKPYLDNNYNGKNLPSTTQPMSYTGKTQLGCDCQGNVVECDENGRIIRVVKQNNR